MAQRELDIIAEARITLNDVDADAPRWTTKRLMQLLSEGQEDMCRTIPLIVRKTQIHTVEGQLEYMLPVDAVKLIRVSAEGSPLTIISYDDIERDNPDWEEDTSASFSAVLVNALSQQTIRPYPIITNSTTLKLRFSSLPIRLKWVEDNLDCENELSISPMWDNALKQYIIGMAFLDYGDESSISRGQLALGLYGKDYNRAEKLSRKSFSKKATTTMYQAKVSTQNYGGRNGSCNTRP